jgi:hypothetical protein
MELVTTEALAKYGSCDHTAMLMDESRTGEDEALTCQRWLRDSAAKRLVYDRLYGDLLKTASPKKILDVGGGLTSLTRVLTASHDYTLLDLLAHDGALAADFVASCGKPGFLRKTDWYSWADTGSYDIVIANDLFPNVDQRLSLFLERFLPRCRELRLSLTYYPDPRFYLTKRIGADEIFCMLAWNGEQTRNTLEKFGARIIDPNLDLLDNPVSSVYPNGRQVCIASLRGHLPSG